MTNSEKRSRIILKASCISAFSIFLHACGGGNSSSTSMTLTGTVAVGAPVINKDVNVTCSSGISSLTKTNSNGVYTIDLNDKLPCSLSVTLDNGVNLYSAVNAGNVANITPITTLGYQIANGNSNNIDYASSKISEELKKIGVYIDSNPFTTRFSADGTGMDKQIELFSANLSALNKSNTAAGSTNEQINALASKINLGQPITQDNDPTLGWWYGVADSLYTFMTSKDPDLSFDTTKKDKFHVWIGGLRLNYAWDTFFALPLSELQKVSDDLTNHLGDIIHRDKATGNIMSDFSKFGPALADVLIKLPTASFSAVPSPGKVGAIFCDTLNSVSDHPNYSEDQMRDYCQSVGDISDIFFSIADFAEFQKSASKFKLTWQTQYNNKTWLMQLGRSSSLKDFVKTTYLTAITGYTDGLALQAWYDEHASILKTIGYSDNDVNDTLGIRPSGVAPNTFSVLATSYPGITFTNPISGQASCTFTATGSWAHDNITAIANGPGGTGYVANATFPYPAGIQHSLIAQRISNGAYLQIGASATVTLGVGEQLYFLINDTLGTYGDNSGSVNVAYSCSASKSGILTVSASDYPGVTFTNPFTSSATCTFTATGNWRMGTQSPLTDANGNTTAVTYPNLPVGTYGYYVVPSAYAGSLVIQRSATSGEFIGTSKQVNFSGNEMVKFLANDVPWPVGGFSTTAFVDNSGSMSVAYSCQ